MWRVLANSFWMPERASTHAETVDPLFYFILGLCIFFTALIVTLLVVFVLRYRHRAGHQQQPSPSHSTRLELTWSIIPTILVLIIFYYGFRGYLRMSVVPPNAYRIDVTARMWNWQFTYPNGYSDGTLHIPVDTPILLVMRSEDVIHSLYVPAFRVKRDAVPGRYNRFWFQARQTGTFDVYCAEYCGTNHSQMLTKVVVHDPTDFQKWLVEAAEAENRLDPVAAGRKLFEGRGCTQCHSSGTTKLIGPGLQDVFGSQVRLADGSTVLAEDNYIRDSILHPQKQIVAGYGGEMPSYAGSLTDRQIDAIIWYMKSISKHHQSPLPSPAATAPTTQSVPATVPRP